MLTNSEWVEQPRLMLTIMLSKTLTIETDKTITNKTFSIRDRDHGGEQKKKPRMAHLLGCPSRKRATAIKDLITVTDPDLYPYCNISSLVAATLLIVLEVIVVEASHLIRTTELTKSSSSSTRETTWDISL
jgi:hypothetical protein